MSSVKKKFIYTPEQLLEMRDAVMEFIRSRVPSSSSVVVANDEPASTTVVRRKTATHRDPTTAATVSPVVTDDDRARLAAIKQQFQTRRDAAATQGTTPTATAIAKTSEPSSDKSKASPPSATATKREPKKAEVAAPPNPLLYKKGWDPVAVLAVASGSEIPSAPLTRAERRREQPRGDSDRRGRSGSNRRGRSESNRRGRSHSGRRNQSNDRRSSNSSGNRDRSHSREKRSVSPFYTGPHRPSLFHMQPSDPYPMPVLDEATMQPSQYMSFTVYDPRHCTTTRYYYPMSEVKQALQEDGSAKDASTTIPEGGEGETEVFDTTVVSDAYDWAIPYVAASAGWRPPIGAPKEMFPAHRYCGGSRNDYLQWLAPLVQEGIQKWKMTQPQIPEPQGEVSNDERAKLRKTKQRDRVMMIKEISDSLMADVDDVALLVKQLLGPIELPPVVKAPLVDGKPPEPKEHKIQVPKTEAEWAIKIAARERHLDLGRHTLGYQVWLRFQASGLVPPLELQTPPARQPCSKRSWEGQVRRWRQLLHCFDQYAPYVMSDVEIAAYALEDEATQAKPATEE